jgi:hypothetical protein
MEQMLIELKRLIDIASERNLIPGGNSHRWIQYYSITNTSIDPNEPHLNSGHDHISAPYGK